ncbi:MAG: hypothetical protein EXR77_12135 [Myxococcales bacterium]|nr:hypothetical protein [Myxococcales bacterium]
MKVHPAATVIAAAVGALSVLAGAGCAENGVKSAAAGGSASASGTISTDGSVYDTQTTEISAANLSGSGEVATQNSELTPDSEVVAADAVAQTQAQSVATAWGTVTGDCGTGWLKAALTSPTPSFHTSTYAFGNVGPFDATKLRALAKQRRNGPNNGGSSNCSEAMSIQTICDCEGSTALKLELQIAFTAKGQTTDWLGELDGVKFGVSVSRVYLGPTTTGYTAVDADKLLKKKLGGINASTLLVAPTDVWKKQVLHLWTLRPEWVPIVQAAWQGLDAATKADTAVLVTVELGSSHIVAETCK